MSRQLGADEVINAKTKDPIQASWISPTGQEPILYLNAPGKCQTGLSGNTTLDQAVKMVRDGGKIIQIAFLEGKVEVDLMGSERRAPLPLSGCTHKQNVGVRGTGRRRKKVNIKPTLARY